MLRKVDVPDESRRYAKDVAGMPCYAAKVPMAFHVGPEAQAAAVPNDDERCAVALACKMQMRTPYASVGRRRTDVALPHPNGVIRPGFGDKEKPPTCWAVYRFENSAEALRMVIAADTGDLDGVGTVVPLMPPRMSDTPGRRRSGKETGTGRKLKGYGQDRLTLLGVRNLNSQRRRKAAR
jgi:hypothetical protein